MDDIRTLTQSVRKGSTPMGEYLWQKKNWSNILVLAGDPYSKAHLVANMLSGLNAEYLSIVVQIEARPITISILAMEVDFLAIVVVLGDFVEEDAPIQLDHLFSPEVLGSDVWFVDSGASNHITSDGASINQKQPYGGKETVTGSLNNYQTPPPVIIHNSSWSNLPVTTFDTTDSSKPGPINPTATAFSEASPSSPQVHSPYIGSYSANNSLISGHPGEEYDGHFDDHFEFGPFDDFVIEPTTTEHVPETDPAALDSEPDLEPQPTLATTLQPTYLWALAHVAAEISWIESLLKELKFPLLLPSITWCDNISASALASNPVFHARTKHIEIEYDGRAGGTGDKKTLEVDAVIGADGANSRVAKSIGAVIMNTPLPFRTVTYKGDIKKFQLATRNRAKDKILGRKII
uniref:Uncharacterized protein n=1 Tax=Cannabis sativa TaxID=3483 RepID=A0A803NM37_CANSA